MSTVFTEFGKLKQVIVGRELEMENRKLDMTFKLFYKSNLQNIHYTDYNEYSINSTLIKERNEDLDNLAKVLENLGIIVYRPEKVNKVIKIKTPTIDTILSSSSNVRDLVFTYGDLILETPPIIMGRIYENWNLRKIFLEQSFKFNKIWIRSPEPELTEDKIDTLDWDYERIYNKEDYKKYDIAIDGAQYIKIGEDILCNYSLHNHYLGKIYIERIIKRFYPKTKIHYTKAMIDNHLDGNILPLNYGTFLVNDAALPKDIKEYLPEKFKDWKIIKCNSYKHIEKNYDCYDTPFLKLCSYRGMDMNVLSIDENTVIVNQDATEVIKKLKENNFKVIPIQLRHCELFGGGIHCSTLDLERIDNEYSKKMDD